MGDLEKAEAGKGKHKVAFSGFFTKVLWKFEGFMD